MDYNKHPHFTIIRRLVEENELPKVGQNFDQIVIVGKTADRPQQITQRRWQLQEHSMGDSCSPWDGLQEKTPFHKQRMIIPAVEIYYLVHKNSLVR